MSLKARLRNPFVQQYILEILFPLVGYFFFDWSLLIIAAFYLIDQISSEIFFLRRLNRIAEETKGVSGLTVLWGPIIGVLAVLCLELLLIYKLWMEPGDLPAMKEELVVFAIEEGWLLFPLVLLVYYLKDQFTFYAPRRFLNYDYKRYARYHHNLNVIMILAIAGILLMIRFLDIHEMVILFTFIVGKVLLDFTVVKWVDKQSLQ